MSLRNIVSSTKCAFTVSLYIKINILNQIWLINGWLLHVKHSAPRIDYQTFMWNNSINQLLTLIYFLWYLLGNLALIEHYCYVLRLGMSQNNALRVYITLKQLSLFVTEKKTNPAKTLDSNNNVAWNIFLQQRILF